MNKVLLLSGHDIDVLQDANIEADIRDVYKKGFIFRILKKNKYLIKYSLGDWKKSLQIIMLLFYLIHIITKELLNVFAD